MSGRTYTVGGSERVPLDRVAARVVGPGWGDVDDFATSAEYGTAPPPMLEYIGPPDFDLTGERHGRVVIVGYYGGKAGRGGARWVGRCDCGTYVRRNANPWRKAENEDDACGRCGRNEYRKRIASDIATGDYPRTPEQP